MKKNENFLIQEYQVLDGKDMMLTSYLGVYTEEEVQKFIAKLEEFGYELKEYDYIDGDIDVNVHVREYRTEVEKGNEIAYVISQAEWPPSLTIEEAISYIG